MNALPLQPVAETRWDGPVFKLRFHPRLPLLSALSPVRDEACVWTWDSRGELKAVLRWSSPQSRPRWDDLSHDRISWIASAWHPTEPTLALIDASGTLRVCEGIGKGGTCRWSKTDAVPDLSSSCVAFCSGGDTLWMGGYLRDGNDAEGASQVLDKSGRLIARTIGCDTCIAIHPEGKLMAALQSDQGATLMRFLRTDAATGSGLEVFDTTLVIDVDGYEGVSFSPRGDRLLMMGNAYEIFAVVHAFPSLRRELVVPLEQWEGLEARLGSVWEAHRWETGERAAFSPDGDAVLVGTFSGDVVEVSLTSETSIRVAQGIHRAPIAALQTRAFDGMMATADFEGRVLLSKLPHDVCGADVVTCPLTKQFVGTSKPVDPSAVWDGLRLFDGIREWNLDRIGDEPLPEDSPTWARIQAAMKELQRGR